MTTIRTTEGTARQDNRYRIPEDVHVAVYAASTGEYQDDLLSGYHSWSGSSLKGKAVQYGGRYKTIRAELVARINGRLAPMGWSAESGLVKKGSPARWHRELILTNPNGVDILWLGE